ncbi:MAG: hypothetical protein KDC39_00465 [Actinobacteria bacterium]|nr:hypothetical protein [Actinomycetota bacterium]
MRHCSQRPENLAEPLAGTAPVETRLILIEQPGPWGREALTENRGNAALRESVASLAEVADTKVYLVRQEHRRSIIERQVWWLHRDETGVTARRDQLSPNAPISVEPPPTAETVTESTTFLCTNGRRDRCCAEFARDLLRPLHDRVWEITHLGGHRFAPTAMRTDGVFFGRLGEAELAAVLAEQAPMEHVRGVFGLAQWQQAALVRVAQEYEVPLNKLTSVGGPDEVSVESADRRWVVPVTMSQSQRLASCDGRMKTVADWSAQRPVLAEPTSSGS